MALHNYDSFEIRRQKKIFKKCATVNIRCDVKKQHSQSEMRALHICHQSQSGMRLIKLLRLGDTRNLGLIHKIFSIVCSIFVLRMSYQPRLFFWTVPLAILQTLLESEYIRTSVLVMCHQRPHQFFIIGLGGNSNL